MRPGLFVFTEKSVSLLILYKNKTMKKKLLLVLITLLTGAVFASAQISTGEPSSSLYKSGNRPEAGDFGVFVGAGLVINSDFANFQLLDRGIRPLINVKYFVTDEIESRLGINIGRRNESVKSTLNADDAKATTNAGANGSFNLYPGVAYHFNKNNLLDVYVGAELPLGFTSASTKEVTDPGSVKSSVLNPYIGLGAFIGLQAFIGNLPLGIALEYGLSGKIGTNNLPKVVENDGTSTQTYYWDDDASVAYKAYSRGGGYIGSEVRLTLSYYFK